MDVLNPTIVIFGIFVGVFILLAVLAVAFGLFDKGHKIIEKKLDRIKARHHKGNRNLEKEQARRALFVRKEVSLLDSLVPKPDELRKRLNKTGRKITLRSYALTSLGLVVFLGVILVALSGFPPLPSMMVGLFLGLFLPHAYINILIRRRLNKFTAQFPEALDLIVRGLQAGLPVTESIHAVSQEMQDPIAAEFHIITDELRLGKTMEEALWSTAQRLDTPDFKFFIISLSVQQETGGNLAETLANLSNILRGRTKLKLKVRAMISEGKASAYIIGALPFIMCGLLTAMNFEYMSVMFTDPRGQIALAGAGIWMGIGVFILAKMINFEV